MFLRIKHKNRQLPRCIDRVGRLLLHVFKSNFFFLFSILNGFEVEQTFDRWDWEGGAGHRDDDAVTACLCCISR